MVMTCNLKLGTFHLYPVRNVAYRGFSTITITMNTTIKTTLTNI